MNVRKIFGISKDKRDNIRQTHTNTHMYISVVAIWAYPLLLDPPSIPLSPPFLGYVCVSVFVFCPLPFLSFSAVWPSTLSCPYVRCDNFVSALLNANIVLSCDRRLECACVVFWFALFLSVAFADVLLLLVCVVRAWSAPALACMAPEGARELFALHWGLLLPRRASPTFAFHLCVRMRLSLLGIALYPHCTNIVHA